MGRISRREIVWASNFYNSPAISGTGRSSDLSRMYGKSRHNFVHVRDIAKGIALVHLAEVLKYEVYNLGYLTCYSLSQAAEAVKEVIPNAEISLSDSITGFEMTSDLFDISRIKEELGFSPGYDIKRGIKDTINFAKYGKYED